MFKHISIYVLFFMLSACYTIKDAYYPDYKNNDIYSLNYYGYHPIDRGEGYYSNYEYSHRNWIVKLPVSSRVRTTP